MAMKDMAMYMVIEPAAYKQFATADGTTPFTGDKVDTLGFNSVTFSLTGVYSSSTETATFSAILEDSEDGTTFTAVPEGSYFVYGHPVSAEKSVYKVSYSGERQFVRCVVKPSAALSDGSTVQIMGVAVMLCPDAAPVV